MPKLMNLTVAFLFVASLLAAARPSAAAEPFVVRAVPRAVYFETVGVLAPKTTTTLASKIMGAVTSVTKREGEPARSGEVLVTIDETEILADLAALEASLAEIDGGMVEIDSNLIALGAGKEAAAAQSELADLTRERFRKLRDARAIATQQYDKVEAERRMASSKLDEVDAQAAVLASKKSQLQAKRQQVDANIAKVRTMLGYARVLAPYDGLVTARQTEVGALAAPGAPLVTIENCCNMRFEARVPEMIINRIRIGDTVEVAVEAAGDARISGRVDEIVPTGDPMTHTFTVKLALPQDPRLKTGMYARGLFPKGTAEALLVPEDHLVRRGQLCFATLPDGTRRFVRPGETRDGMTEILSGLAADDTVTVSDAIVPAK